MQRKNFPNRKPLQKNSNLKGKCRQISQKLPGKKKETDQSQEAIRVDERSIHREREMGVKEC